jgi:hypothetical protein
MVTGYIKLANGHEKLVIDHDEKLNFFKTGHRTDWSDWSWADYDLLSQTPEHPKCELFCFFKRTFIN